LGKESLEIAILRKGLKSLIFITADKRSAVCGKQKQQNNCLKGRVFNEKQ